MCGVYKVYSKYGFATFQNTAHWGSASGGFCFWALFNTGLWGSGLGNGIVFGLFWSLLFAARVLSLNRRSTSREHGDNTLSRFRTTRGRTGSQGRRKEREQARHQLRDKSSAPSTYRFTCYMCTYIGYRLGCPRSNGSPSAAAMEARRGDRVLRQANGTEDLDESQDQSFIDTEDTHEYVRTLH